MSVQVGDVKARLVERAVTCWLVGDEEWVDPSCGERWGG